MYSDEFERTFGEFLDSDEYEQLSALLFDLSRKAFAAGWRAALRSRRTGEED